MKKTFTRRSYIRMVSFLSAIIVVLGIYSGVENTRSSRYREVLEAGYQRSLQELTSYLSNLSLLLQKSSYTASSTQLSSLASKIRSDASGAKSCLTSLPIGQMELDNTCHFLSQVGDYASYLAGKAENGERITEEETTNFRLLTEHAGTLSDQFEILEQNILDGQVRIGEIEKAVLNTDKPMSEEMGRISDGFGEMEDGFTDLPALLYDGPFSDHIMQKKPVLTQDQPDISRTDAREKAAAAMNVPAAELRDDSDEESNMPSFCFSTESGSAGVTKQGGYLTYLSIQRDVAEQKIGENEILKCAEDFLSQMGLESMQETYFENRNGVRVYNFAYRQGEVLCYTDLVKVGVALDNGEILFYEARGYINNHRERQLPSPALSLQQAQEKLNTHLKVLSSKLALTPTAGLNEKLCYEFLTQDENGQKVLVYLNAQSGNEEQILMLMENENGTLTL